MAGFVHALESEITELQRELDADPRAVKLRELRRVLTLYVPGATPVPVTTARNAADDAVTMTDNTVASLAPRVSKWAPMWDVVEQFLADRTEPVTTNEIFDYLKREHPTMELPAGQNAAHTALGRAGRFTSHGRQGWTLNCAPSPEQVAETVDAEPLSEGEAPTASVEARQTNGRTQGWLSLPPQASAHVNPWAGGGT